MSSCICLVIKDEQEYLEEWISYHINLGVEHIFIFEDIDSCSHQSITDKYTQVTLNSIDLVLNTADKQKARELKQTKKSSVHRLYLKSMLSYMSKFYADMYDWCFTIDVDEFITLEDTKNINETLSLYDGYDAVVLRWKCYGAGGHISKHNYANLGVVASFPNEATGFVREKPSCFCKTCYNIKKYRPDFFGTSHSPKDICNYCNTDFIKSDILPSYKNMYIRHYITKSWEEYVWKMQVRGFMWGKRRGFDFFFEVNPDLLDKKGELMAELEKEVLVVMPYSGTRAQGKEIELALSGWRKFCRFNYHFVVIGDFGNVDQSKFPWVEFINCPRVPTVMGQYVPHLDIVHKFFVVWDKYKNKYKDFIYMSDDKYAIKPFCLADILQTHYHEISFTGDPSKPTSYWRHNKWKTRQLLDREGLPHINYTTHFPVYYNFDKLKEITDKYNLFNESYVIEDVYFNYFEHDEPILDSKIRLGVCCNKDYREGFEKALSDVNIKFIFNSVEGWSKELESSLEKIVEGD